MSDIDYKALFLQAQEDRRKAEEEKREEKLLREQAEKDRREEKLLREQAEEDRRQEKLLREQAEALREQAEALREQTEALREQSEALREQSEARNRRTTFAEFIQSGHDLLSRPLRAGDPARSTTGNIPQPTGKHCPLRLEPWTDCATRQQEIYNSVWHYLQPRDRDPPRLFPPHLVLEEHGRRFANRPITSEKDLESYERLAVENHVVDIISALCKIPSAREEFCLGDGMWFENHANTLEENPPENQQRADSSSTNRPSRPDQFCIHRVNGNTMALLTTVEYKPPHKLSIETLRDGLRSMNFYHEIVEQETVPPDGPEKSRYNAARLAGSAIVQEYHVMIQEGLEYSYLTTGLGIVFLRVPDDCRTLYYHLCEPNVDVDSSVGGGQGPRTAIERVLCLCLMSFRSARRDQTWRNAAQARLPTWETSFNHTLSQPASSESASSENSPSEYSPSSPESPESLVSEGRRPRTRSTGCAPTSAAHREDSPDSDPDPDPAAAERRKRGFSQIASSPPTQRSTPTTPHSPPQRHTSQPRPHNHRFCTQKCLLGLQRGDALDASCPNVELHRAGQQHTHHPIRAPELVHRIKQQLDANLDEYCTPMGGCGSYGAPFKVTCAAYGYTVVGKGTTTRLWSTVSQEAEIYRILQSLQGSAVPVFLGPIDLAMIYFLHGAGQIRHMLLMGWGGENMSHVEIDATIQRAISRAKRKILSLGVVHEDLRPENILWNEELQRALIIDFHRCHLNNRLMPGNPRSRKRRSSETSEQNIKRVRGP
ncbi:hypothetical protein AOCH_007772 [Aspergillus ochraceoroseus]|uniref:Protein kinase domain-containing protein n=1 Tax=Aspergillus ochraceoroseus TaxID=138278 RepID=A0A0F8U764_9EURO|nr:hypothetical protein AOCH_007772 [Aspergillus ochraceoroseus]